MLNIPSILFGLLFVLISSATISATPLWDIPLEGYSLHRHRRANTSVNPNSITGTTCNDPATTLVSHDINVAILSICGGIAGTIEFCGGDPATTTGASGTAKFTLTATDAGATINISKGRWEGCVRAARAACGDSPLTSTCIGGASTGNVDFVLAAN